MLKLQVGKFVDILDSKKITESNNPAIKLEISIKPFIVLAVLR